MHKEGARDVEVYTVSLGEKVWTPEELGELFVNKATDHVAEVPGTQLFMLFAHYENAAPVRRGFRINNTDTEFGYGGTTEPPTPMGEKMQSMRWGEFSFQQNMKHTQFLMNLQYKIIQRTDAQNSKLMSENHDALEIAKTTILQAAQIEAQKILEANERTERKEFVKMLPPLINRALGAEVFPQSEVKSRLFDKLLEKVDSEEKLEKVAELFGPEAASVVAHMKAQELEGKTRALEVAKRVADEKSTELDDELH